MKNFVSRAGQKLEHALGVFRINLTGKVCADFGASTGGFTDCMLQNGAVKVYSVETGYGVLDWKLRNDPRVVVLERENAMHVALPEKMDLITIDTSWTKLAKVLPNALKNLKEGGELVALLKPHYELSSKVRKGKLDDLLAENLMKEKMEELKELGFSVACTESPIVGERAGNKEYLLYIKE